MDSDFDMSAWDINVIIWMFAQLGFGGCFERIRLDGEDRVMLLSSAEWGKAGSSNAMTKAAAYDRCGLCCRFAVLFLFCFRRVYEKCSVLLCSMSVGTERQILFSELLFLSTPIIYYP